MKQLKFQMPPVSHETGIWNKAMSVSSRFPPPSPRCLVPLALEAPEAPDLAAWMGC